MIYQCSIIIFIMLMIYLILALVFLLSILSILSVPDEGYSRNVLCALNLISMFYYGLLSYLQNCASNDLCMFL